jgi:hypothetical protein
MRSLMWLRTVGLALLVVGLSAVGTGCGGSGDQRARVKGKVKFFDKYLTAGTVAFFSKDGRVGSGGIDADGNYEVSDAPVGECTITVKVPTMPRGPVPKMQPKPPPGVPEARMPGAEEDKNFVPHGFDVSKIVQIPGKYADRETSGLTYVVSKGEQTKDITLSP